MYETNDMKFKIEFINLIDKYPCPMSDYFRNKIDDYSPRPKEKATHKTIDEVIESFENFIKKYPNFTILSSDDSYSCLYGFLIYTAEGGKEMKNIRAERITISPYNARRSDLNKIIKEKFKENFIE